MRALTVPRRRGFSSGNVPAGSTRTSRQTIARMEGRPDNIGKVGLSIRATMRWVCVWERNPNRRRLVAAAVVVVRDDMTSERMCDSR